MKLFSLVSGLALVSATIATPTLAQSVAPTGTNFTATGNATLDKTGYPTQYCVLTLSGNSGDGVNGTISGGSNTGGGYCLVITVDPADFEITSTVDSSTVEGKIDRLIVRLNGAEICNETDRLFKVDTAGNISFNSSIAPDCNVTASLNTPSVYAVP